ncbi:MAG: sensor histidine kinase [Bacteroidota bacterium]|nr:sensor histidine kinase [Bacteroidota bacterium]
MQKIKVLFLVFICHFVCISQNDNIDSLKSQLNFESNPTAKIDLLNKISRQFYFNGEVEQIIPYAEKALILSEKIKYKKGICLSFKNIGTAHKMYGDNSKAIYYFQKALKISEEIKDKAIQADILAYIGLVYEGQDDYKFAFSTFLRSLKLREEIKDEKGIASSFNNIGIIYYNQGNYNEALVYYNKSLDLKSKLHEYRGIVELYNNIGNVYMDQSKFDSTLSILFKALALEKKLQDKNGLALTFNNLGLCYRLINKNDSALFYHKKSFAINQLMKNKKGIALAAYNVGYDFFNLNKIDSAKYYAEISLLNSQIINNLYIKRSSITLLSLINEKNKDFKLALLFNRMASEINDTIYSIESQRNTAEMNAKYESEKKENEIKLLNSENNIKTLEIKEQQHRIKNHGILVGSLILLIVLVIALSWLVISRKEIKQKGILKAELLKQQELRTEAIIDTQEKERKRIAQDLHDGIGQTLASVKVNLVNISVQSELNSENNLKKIQQTIKSLDDAYKEVRTLSHKMMPKALEEVGLAGAFNDLLEKTLYSLKIKYTFEKDNITRLNENIEIGLYRIFQELLNNILKHANATEISVHLHKTQTHVILIVEDNGIGIKHNREPGTGIGLSNIETRAYTLKGHFSINSEVTGGTVAVIRIPIV